MSEVNVKIDSQVNEIFAKTKVTQKFSNKNKEPIELKIYLDKNPKLLFLSFNAKIGNSIMVKSKIMKKEKAEIKYVDNISEGNAAIFVTEDPDNEKRIIINMGNIPPNEEVLFTCEYLYLIKSSVIYEFELFQNLPIFKWKNINFKNTNLKGNTHIKAKNKIININKIIGNDKLKIIEEKYINEEKNEYLISYQIDNLLELSDNVYKTKIYFETELIEPLIFSQKSSIISNEKNYIINYKHLNRKINKSALFIFLIDQSGSMGGIEIVIVRKALNLFLQSLPANSYYQLPSNFFSWIKLFFY